VAGGTASGQPHPGLALLGGHDRVQAQVLVHGVAEAADLADRLGAAVEQLTMVLGDPVRTELAAGLLIGEEGQDDVAFGSPALVVPVAHHREHHRAHVLHVDRAAAPHVAVVHLSGQRVDLPVGGRGRHDVEVAVHQQGRPAGVGPGDAAEQIGPARLGLDEAHLDTGRRQVLGDVLGRRPFVAALHTAEVVGVDPDQVTADRHDVGVRILLQGGASFYVAARDRALTTFTGRQYLITDQTSGKAVTAVSCL